ncbi:nucleoside monophosphate kinase [uncultured Tenacibaculum sp.]|uniref:nucleoside monophosphate kinase n=1 Tax=uncultured Tenacibaculum sp. TaxID=174713 RepID=UPI0026246840|nr:nucleoside monophosphate kinase [uncultured Tenacibaculum sp.]
MSRKIQIVYSLDFLTDNIFLDILSQNSNSQIIDLKKNIKEEIESENYLGIKLKEQINTGSFISDDLITDLIFKEIKKSKRNIVLKNYPTSIDQYKKLKNKLKSTNTGISRFWKLSTLNVDQVVQNEIKKLETLNYLKTDINPSSIRNEINIRITNLNNSINDLIKTEYIKLNEINVDFEKDLTNLFIEKITNNDIIF